MDPLYVQKMAGVTEQTNGNSIPSLGNDDLNQKIKEKGDQVRELKTAKAVKVKENSLFHLEFI